jgi:hypothetical protein
MSESDPTGYGDSPDTADGPVEDGQQDTAQDAGGDGDTTLTTDAEAQRDDSVMRPGNEPD